MNEKPFSNEIQETKEHGSESFHFTIYPCIIPNDLPSFALHWHKNMELIYVKKGKGKVQFGLETKEADAGDIFILPPQSLHALFHLPGYTMEYENILFDVNFLGGGVSDVCDREYLVPLVTGRLLVPRCLSRGDKGYHQVLSCINDAESLYNTRHRGYELGIKADMMRLLYLLLSLSPETPVIETPDVERFKKIVSQIEQRYSEPISVTSMADFCGCSNSHFMRWFKRMTGTSFTSYLNGRRLAYAAELLYKTDDKILTIAQNVGFENLSNFNRQFKARYRMTPSQYRSSGQHPFSAQT